MKTGYIDLKEIDGGWSFGFSKSSNRSAPSKKGGTYYTGLLSNTRTGYEGLIGSAMGEVLVSTVPSLFVNATLASDGNGYAIAEDGRITQLSLPIGVGSSYTAPSGVTTDGYKDIWTHVDTGGNDALFFTYQTGTNAYVGYKQVNSVTRNDTYITLSNRNVPHVGVVSANNRSYITDGNIVRAYDPAVGASTTTINVGLGWTTVSVADYGEYCAIVGNKGGISRLWLWDGIGTSYKFQYEIRDFTVSAVVNEGGSLKVFCKGRNGTTKIKTFSSGGFSEEADFEVDSSYSDSPAHNMTDVWMNQIAWRTQTGSLWTYGSIKKDSYRTGAHRVGSVTTDQSQGFVKNLYGSNLYTCKKVGSIYTLSYFSPSDSPSLTSSIVSDLTELPHKSTVQFIEVTFANFVVSGNSTAGNSFILSLYKGKETVDQINASIPADNTLQGTNIYYYPIRAKISSIDSYYLSATFTGIIKKIRVHYAFEDNAL